MRREIKKSILVCILLYFCTVMTGTHYNDSLLQSMTFPNVYQLPSVRISVVFQDSEGYMWYGTKDDGLCRDDGYTIEIFRSDFMHPELSMNNWITAITEDDKGRLWIGTKRGLYILDKQDYSIQSAQDEELQTWAFDDVSFSTNNIIVANANGYRLIYNSEGACIRREKVNIATKQWEQTIDRKGRIWKLDTEGTPIILSYPILEVKKGNFKDLHITRNIKVEQLSLPEGLKIHFVQKDTAGNLWLGTNKSLWKYSKEKTWQQMDERIGVINSLEITTEGTLFLGTEHHGLMSYKDGKLASLAPGADKVMSMSMIGDSILWMSTLDGRLLAYDIISDSPKINAQSPKNKLTDHSARCGLHGDAILSVVADREGRIWMLTNQCLTIYSPDIETVHYFYPTDMKPQPVQFLMLYADVEGNIHLENDKGLFAINLMSEKKDEVVPHTEVSLSCYQTDGTRHFLGNDKQKISLSPDERNVHLYFTTFDQLNARKIRFAFRHQNENEWHYLEKGCNDVYLTQLSRGNHNIEVKATDENGIWSSKILALAVYCAPHWWETTVAFVFYFLLLAGLILFQLYHFYQRQKQLIIDRQMEKSAGDIQAVLQETAAVEDAFIQNVAAIIENNLQYSGFSVEELSRQLAMERTGFYRKLTASIGKTPTEFIRSIRLRRAKDLLNQGRSISEVSDLVGFSTPSYFSNCFLKEYGIRPSEYVASLNSSENHL